MHISKYLIISKGNKAWNATVKIIDKLGKAQIPANAVVLKLNLDLPDSLFTKPQLEASIKIDSDKVNPPIINGETVHNIQELISQQLGVDLKISVVSSDSNNKIKEDDYE